jgi:hypothetical protein
MAGTRHRDSVAVVSVDRPRQIATAQPAPKRPGNGKRVLANTGLVLLLGGALAGLGWAFQSDTFRVREVDVSATSATVRQSIEDMLAPGCPESVPGMVECPDGLLGANELTLSTADLQRQLQQIPLVKSATVKSQLPDRLEIDVVERQPEAAWLVGSQVFRVADDGVVIDEGSANGLKVAIGQVAGEAVKPGDKIDLAVIKGAELLQDQLPATLGIPAKRIQYSPVDGLAVIGDQDFIAMFGPPQDLNLKMAELQRVVQLAKDKKATLAFVDLRYKTPYFRTR